ncbi:MAG TPA: NmrA/HSCARG family protein [Polyangia bacterium]|nr:NmrA/HSCARG family protein [Polyangia bacterium]
MTKRRSVLVTGATGKQGGEVARQLIGKGHHVRALTRDASKPAAQALAALGAELAVGNLDDRASIQRAVDGVDAVFAVATPFEEGTQAETQQGINVADTATAAGVQLLYSSVANADRQTGIPHFDSKFAVEQHIRSRGDGSATILAPVYFMENLGFVRAQLREGVYPSALTPDRKLAQIAVSDIAAVAVAVLEDGAAHAGKRYDLGGDELSANQVIEALARVTGRRFNHYQLPTEAVRGAMGDDGVRMNQWFESTGYTFDAAALRRTFPTVPWLSFEAWARGQDWSWLNG